MKLKKLVKNIIKYYRISQRIKKERKRVRPFVKKALIVGGVYHKEGALTKEDLIKLDRFLHSTTFLGSVEEAIRTYRDPKIVQEIITEKLLKSLDRTAEQNRVIKQTLNN